MERYFDANATTPLRPEARAAWVEAMDAFWQNPSSPYRSAARVHARLEDARETLAELFGIAADNVVFNSGATEGNRDVLAYWHRLMSGSRIAVSAVEHPAVLENARQFWGERASIIPVGEQGRVSLSSLEAAIDDGATLISLMTANNETGVKQPWREALTLCRKRRVALHVDATQWVGRESLDGLGEVDFVTGSGHKFGGPKGTGFLLVSALHSGFSGQRGGAQENDHRAGTENFPAIAGMLAALSAAEAERASVAARWHEGRTAFEQALLNDLPGVRIWGQGAERLANTVSAGMPAGENTRWVRLLDQRGFAVSTGSACATGKEGPSYVLAAMGVEADDARRTVRISALPTATFEDWRDLASAFRESYQEIRAPRSGSQVIDIP
ncbi:MAG: cysteine desulfurase family protein [Puniceicoccales bacterium]